MNQVLGNCKSYPRFFEEVEGKGEYVYAEDRIEFLAVFENSSI